MGMRKPAFCREFADEYKSRVLKEFLSLRSSTRAKGVDKRSLGDRCFGQLTCDDLPG